MRKAMLIDTTVCTGCRACQVACKQWNKLPAEETSFSGSYENPPRFSPVTWTKIVYREHEPNEEGAPPRWFFAKQGCMHCTNAACEKVCPAGAISHTEYGTVYIDETRCIGCNYCVANCTYNVIGFDQAANVARKCTFCYDRISNGLPPACAKTCPAEAITYGDRADIVALANRRAKTLKANGKPQARVYGLEELDGLGMMYVLDGNPADYGLIEEPRIRTSTHIWSIIFKPVRAVLVLAMAFALWVNKGESKKVEERA